MISPHVVELNVLIGIFPRFYIDLLKRASKDPLPLQLVGDSQPPPLIPATEDHKAEYKVERILRAENKKRGRGTRREVLVKWTRYTACTWEPRVNLEDIVALDEFKAIYSLGDGVGEEDAGAMIGRNREHKGRNARLFTLGAAGWECLCREEILSDLDIGGGG